MKQQYIDGDIQTEQEYSSRLREIERDRLKDKLKVVGLDEKQASDYMQRIKDLELDVLKRIKDMTQAQAKDTSVAKLEILQKEYEANQAYLKDAYVNGIIPTEERYKEYLLALENNFNQKKKELLERLADEQLAELRTREEAELQEIKLQRAQRLLTEEQYWKVVEQLPEGNALL